MTVQWTSHQRHAIDCIACKAGIPTRPRRYIAAESVVILPPRSRFNTPRLAATLTQALRTRTS